MPDNEYDKRRERFLRRTRIVAEREGVRGLIVECLRAHNMDMRTFQGEKAVDTILDALQTNGYVITKAKPAGGRTPAPLPPAPVGSVVTAVGDHDLLGEDPRSAALRMRHAPRFWRQPRGA